MRWRRCLLGRAGPYVVAGLCAVEIVGLVPSTPVAPLTTVVRRRRIVGVVILAALFHHWFIEQGDHR